MLLWSSIRRSIIVLKFSAILAVSLTAQAQENEQEFAFTNLFNSTELGEGCYRIPALVTASNGDLIAAID